MDFIITVHLYLRFVILALGGVGVLRSLVSLGTRQAAFMRLDEMLSRGFSGALDLQMLAGIALTIFLLSQSLPVTWLHPIVMLPAVGVSHLGRRFRGRADRDRHRGQLGIYLGSLALIVVGLLVIGQLRVL